MAEKDEIFRISSLVESLLRRAGEQLVCRGEDLVLALIERSGGACTPGELSKLACGQHGTDSSRAEFVIS